MSYSLKDLAKDTITGSVEFVDQETYKKRINICNICDYNNYRTCTKCGCLVDLKTKLTKACCPMGKW